MNLKETELSLGLPGGAQAVETPTKSSVGNKRGFSETVDLKFSLHSNKQGPVEEKILLKDPAKPPTKAQVVGWPPVRNYRKNVMAQPKSSEGEEASSGGGGGGIVGFVKVSMDGAPYLRKVDLKMYKSYKDLSDALTKMLSSFTMGSYGAQGMINFMNESKVMDLLNSSEYVPSYEDKDGDWMLVGDVPWPMFIESCKRLRIMKGSEAIGLAPRAMEKCKNRS
ncbi:unnamed protein product [Microthlaspi erraticum]|uniref:Auxin-responsive protein n=1 Tax=Microthlaspi erraticum TaxID=1685480 RepID=A0A6D2INF2_9BRAS|nr:unnamed protein product [Microthlaspi erraticum]